MGVVIHGLLVLIGLALVALGIQFFLSSRNFRETGVRTLATVRDNIAMESRNNSGTSIMYAPLLEYAVKGEKKTYTPNARSNPPAYDIGEKVPIVYSPNNYQKVRIISYWGIYLGSNILFAFGLPILVIGAGYFLFKWGII
ncbi:MAG: DUF3592 domain-containing protein [Sphingobacterium sp.]|uniref:DUF3592 domain-containing protein n=1 Tax=Sphingobacterium sp. JB170 TaxID=1434842 RepID=UPI000B3602F8|nr:DUF3592 domain-containing protein [Sphingobacterium sp. JB170]